MKKLLVIAVVLAALLVSCAESKTFKRSDGTEFKAHPYGWFDRDDYRIDGVEYEVCAGNVVWSIFLSETVVAPILITAVGLYEPVSYTEPQKAENNK